MDTLKSILDFGREDFDVILLGTDLAQLILSAALSCAGKSVLHIDSQPFYGSCNASLPFNTLVDTLKKGSSSAAESVNPNTFHHLGISNVEFAPFNETNQKAIISENNVNLYSIDLNPQLIWNQSLALDTIIPHSITHNVFFSPVESIYLPSSLFSATGANDDRSKTSVIGKLSGDHANVEDALTDFEPVPLDRSSIFLSHLSLAEKRMLMKFIKSIINPSSSSLNSSLMPIDQNATSNHEVDLAGESSTIHHNESFSSYLQRHSLSQKLEKIVTHVGALDSKPIGSGQSMQTSEALKGIKRFLSSLGLYESPTPFVYSLYGTSSLGQAFSRLCAIYGGLQVLNHSVSSLSIDPYGVQFSPYQYLACEFIVTNCNNFHLVCTNHLASKNEVKAPIQMQEVHHPFYCDNHILSLLKSNTSIARAILILKHRLPITTTNKTSLVFIPPNTDPIGNPDTIYAFQLGPELKISPENRTILYLWTMGRPDVTARESLEGFVNHWTVPYSSLEGDVPDHQLAKHPKAVVMWLAYYTQNVSDISQLEKEEHPLPLNLLIAPEMVQGFDIEASFTLAQKLFHRICPDKPFLFDLPTSA